ncbi:MAG: septal ring lytic transglycosylase RlpA family protein [Treponema sp.]|jgi:rare lipoprotein A|nr:septal ring lytic transglycosylase RlpA family protein [Treponema sp.]
MKRIISPVFAGLLIALVSAPRMNAQVQPENGGQIFRQEGIASWYGTEFDGRPTASGEIFNSALLTAAHPTLPFGTILSVTNTHNNRKVTVRVNDRGPFVSARIIDVSRAAAEQLDMLATGTAPVIVESSGPVVLPAGTETGGVPAVASAPGSGSGFIDPGWATAPVEAAPPPPQAAPLPQQAAPRPAGETMVPAQAAPPPQPAAPQPAAIPAIPEYNGAAYPPQTATLKPAVPPVPGKRYRLQVGSYRIARNAVDAFEKLKNAGLSPAYERYGEFFRVVLAGVRGEEVQSVAERLGAAGFREALIREEP